jgi:phosphate/sulfate permease
MIEATWELIVIIIGIALFFDFTNGFHDSANSISTVVSTKVLSPRNAVIFAAFLILSLHLVSVLRWQAPSARLSSWIMSGPK